MCDENAVVARRLQTIDSMAVQFQRLEAFPELPGAAALDEEAEAALLGIPAAAVVELRRAMREEVAGAAARLVERDEVRRALVALPPGFTFACVGDSLTADHQSWAEMLAETLVSVRPDVRLLNLARSGATSLDAVRRVAGLGERPALYVVLIGTNDAIRYDIAPGAPLVSDAETRTNLERLAGFAASRGASLVWVTPPPILPAVVAAFPVFRELGLGWAAEDVARKAGLVRERAEPVIDLWAAFDGADLASLLLDDGLHLSVSGQAVVAAEVVIQGLEPRP